MAEQSSSCGEVIGMAEIVGANSLSNPRLSGGALPSLNLNEGSLSVHVHPPFKGVGDTKFRLFLAALGESERETFRALLASADRPTNTMHRKVGISEVK